MTIPRRTALMLIAAAPLALAGCAKAALVQDIESRPYGGEAYTPLALSDYERAIVRAGAERGWQFRRLGTGHLEGRILVRGKHLAVVDVNFTREVFSIRYRDSENLEYDPATGAIHGNYNKWVTTLSEDIQAEVRRLRAA